MADTTDQEHFQDHLPIFERVALLLSTPCQGHLVRMVLLRDENAR